LGIFLIIRGIYKFYKSARLESIPFFRGPLKDPDFNGNRQRILSVCKERPVRITYV
jgi:hypothetical protein